MVINMNYKTLIKPFEELVKNESDEISLLANMSAFINEYVTDLNWVGFYLNKNNTLYLGPFQGKVACSIIDFGKGVCGTAFKEKRTLVVPNVHDFNGHITCDSDSNSEVVIPIIINSIVYGVLDVDSPKLNRFDDELVSFLESLVTILGNKLLII